MRTIYSDVLCIGCRGLPGERVALAAAMEGFHTICLSVVPPRRSHSSAAQGGMQAALGNAVMGKGDSTDIHFADTVKGSDWGCDQEVARTFADSAPIVMREMAHWGVPWNRVVAGKHTYYKGGKPFEAEEEESKHGSSTPAPSAAPRNGVPVTRLTARTFRAEHPRQQMSPVRRGNPRSDAGRSPHP